MISPRDQARGESPRRETLPLPEPLIAKPSRIVIADDLTGAADAGVQFAMAGLRVRLELGDPRPLLRDVVSDVLAYTTNTRAMPPPEAYLRTRNAALAAGDRPIYKKIDSTLRGNLGAEIDAVLDVTSSTAALVCPAVPQQRRTVVDGHLLVDRTPVSRTSFAEDPAAPVRESHIPTLFARQSDRCVGSVPLSTVSSGPPAVLARLRDLLADGATIIVADAARDADLDCLAAAAAHIALPLLLCGSSGLAAALASPQHALPARRPVVTPRVVAVIGSINPVSIAQAEVLSREAQWPLLRMDGPAAFAGGGAWRGWLQTARTGFEDTAAVVIVAPADAIDNAHGAPLSDIAAVLADRLAEVAEIAMSSIHPGTAIVTGGDTAAAVLRRLGAQAVDLAGELEPGIPFGRVRGGSQDDLQIATKAGGFGDVGVLWRTASRLTSGAESR